MTILEAIEARHSVRKYIDRPIELEKIAALRGCIDHCNAEGGLHIQLVTEEPKAFAAGLWKYGQFSGVRNYLVMAAAPGKEVEERVGYYGEKLVLLAQTLGLNTCWVGLTYKKIPGTFTLSGDEIVHCVIALGYGQNQGVQHPLKPVEKFYETTVTPVPDWFLAGMNAAVLAPTAVNQQKFKFILHPDGTVETRTLPSIFGYTHIDLGIVKYHFELAADR
jgi:nitroreductase